MSSTTTNSPKRRGLRLTVGMMMVLVLVLCLGLGQQSNRARRQREVVAAVESHGGWVHYDYEFVNGTLTPGRSPGAPDWLRRNLGDEYFQEIRQVSFVYDNSTGTRYDNADTRSCDDALALLEGQSGLKYLLMKGTQATDKGLSHLRGLTGLEDLYIWDSTLISDAGVENLRGLVNLRHLHLDKSRMTDEGFRHLARMKQMERLSLQGHAFSDRGLATVEGMTELTLLGVGGSERVASLITDDGLIVLKDLKKLRNLDLSYSRVTDRGLKQLSGLKALRILDLNGCEGITDAGLAELSDLVNLKWLLLRGTNVTDEGLEYLTELKHLRLLTLPDGISTESKKQYRSRLPGSPAVY